MKRTRIFSVTSLALGMLGAAAFAAEGGAPPRPPGAPQKTIHVNLDLEASENLHKDWPGAKFTRHYGKGYIEPFGAAEYYCGNGFPEEKQYPLSEWEKGMFEKFTGQADAQFCVYRTKDGNFYVYDSVVGTRHVESDGSQNEMLNIVIDGSGAYRGATGIWLGLTEGRGAGGPPPGGPAGAGGPPPGPPATASENGPGASLAGQGKAAPVLLKVMSGYVKIPDAK